ncbi:hypothetical protein REPUB_Repub03eG0273400 [Reevesia pubescens]
MDTVTIRKAIESLEKELRRAKMLIKRPDSKQPNIWIEDVIQDLGRSVSLSSSPSLSPSPSHQSEFVSATASEKEIDEERVEIEEERTNLTIDDVVLQLKYGNDEEFNFALLSFNEFFRQGLITNEWINEEGIIPILVNRLGSCKPNNRLIINRILRNLALENAGNKEKMADAASLSALVKSLTRDVEERREAVGLFLDLSDLPAVWRRLGRIQGCIVMLVTILNGDDPIASDNAGKLLNALSSNTQNALHMAEAGYFKPLVHYLKECSDMSKILMATAMSRMELTDQSRASLGEDGAVEPLVKIFNTGKLEAKLSALNALQNLSNLSKNIQRLIGSGIVVSLLQLLFSVTSVLMTLRVPASAILARIAQSESILVNQDVAQQMFSILNLSSPKELTEQLGESDLNVIVNIISSSSLETVKASAVGILSNIPISKKKATEVLKMANLLPILISAMSMTSSPSTLTTPWIEQNEVIPSLVKLVSSGSFWLLKPEPLPH